MKLLHILDSIKYSGAEIMLKVAAPYFIEQGIELHVLAIGNEKGEFANQLAEVGFTVHHKPMSKKLSYLLQQKSWFKEMGFDAIHIHPEKSFIVQAFASKLANVNAIRTIHTHFGFSGVLRFRKKIERFIARCMKIQMVTISNSVRNHELKVFGNKAITIYNWTDESRFYPSKENKAQLKQEFNFSSEDKVVLTIGSCQAVKRHTHILEAIKLIKDPSIKYLQVGDGPDFEEEKALAKKLNISDRVNFVQYLDKPEIAYHLADLFVMTSKYEGLSIASLEAMYCGLMPIMYDVPGLSEILKDSNGQNEEGAGRLIEESPKVLAKEIVHWLEKNEARKEKANYASKWVKSKFDRIKSLDKYIQLYRN